jgi:hypothetical protein
MIASIGAHRIGKIKAHSSREIGEGITKMPLSKKEIGREKPVFMN